MNSGGVFGLRWHDESEAVECVADLAAMKAETDNGTTSVFDRGEFFGDGGFRGCQQLRSGVCRGLRR